MSQRRDQDLLTALAIALIGHGVVGAVVSQVEHAPPMADVLENDVTFEFLDSPEPKIEARAEPEIEPAAEPEIEAQVQPRRVAVAKPRPTPVREPEPVPSSNPQPSEPVPDWAQGPAAPGPPDPSLPGGYAYDLASLSPGGAVPVAVGQSPKAGPGGKGAGTGAGGKAGGSGAKPIPVSVAMIKRRPVPIGDTDFVDARKNYPAAAKAAGVEGEIKVRLVVDVEGNVASRKLVTKLGSGLDQLALRLAKKLRFKAAIDANDNPVPASVVWTFHFTLPK